ncbi:hypothetical protein D6779_01015 [Candidatus Parcubacteria bacterium]|nr:MAG: hypothetical protein D6779_01015 [Candidatus Parcubacteria bacterium]
MSKLIVDQLQHNGGQAFELPLNHPAVQSILMSDPTGALSFADPKSLFAVIKVKSESDPDPADTTFDVGDLFLNTFTGELFVCTYKSGATGKVRWAGSNGSLINYPMGEQMYTSPGSYTFIVPDGVYSIGAVLVGGGGGGHYNWPNSAGGGGALAYVNNIPVTPGEGLTVIVGAGGNAGGNGGDTLLKRGGTTIFGAAGGKYNATSESARAKPIAGIIVPRGGAGGLCAGTGYGGGGGAGGYGSRPDGLDACGGDGLYGTTGSLSTFGASAANQPNRYGFGINGAACGGVGYQSSTYGFGGGGGVGLFGRGSSGVHQTSVGGNSFYAWWNGGGGGSLGGNGASNNNSSHTLAFFDGASWVTYTGYHGEGGRFGGGGAGGGTSVNASANYCNGGGGGARLVWGVRVDFTTAVPKVTSDAGVV